MKKSESRVMWDSEPWCAVYVPYDEDYVDAFKAQVHVRAWDKTSGCWWIPSRYLPVTLRLISKYINVDLHVGAAVSMPGPVAKVPHEYEVLCVKPDAPNEVVRAAYKALAFLVHPDRGGAAEHFVELTQAYERVCRERGI